LSLSHCNTAELLAWYDVHKRDLPWRHTRDPYAVWISEIMLQQTQVRTVLPRYAAWLQQFPDVTTLAAASEDTVLKAWEGLGYYRRARFAHRAAQQIVLQHDGVFPHCFDDIMALPGIGRSTAGAIAAFCFDAPFPVLDGNVKRVLHRYFGEATVAQQWQQAECLIRQSGEPAIWNQATMELGASLCSRTRPDCSSCPWQSSCRAVREGDLAPPPSNKTKVQDVYWQAHLHYRHNHAELWLERRPAGGIWGGLWSPPVHILPDKPEHPPVLVHQLTHRRLHLYALLLAEEPSNETAGQWFDVASCPAMPTGIQRLLHLSRPT